MDEEARLQAAIAMTQLSSTSTLGRGDQVQWRHLAFGGKHREEYEEQPEEKGGLKVKGQISENNRQKAVVMEEVSKAADPETGEFRSAPEVNDSTHDCPSQSRTGQKVVGDSCGTNKMERESRGLLLKSCDRVEEKNPEFGNRSHLGSNLSEYRIGVEAMTGAFPPVAAGDKSSFSDERCIKGKFVRTAQASDPGEAPWLGKTSDIMTGKCQDGLIVSCEGTAVVKRKITRTSDDDARPSKIPRQRKSSKNAPSQATKGRRGSSKNHRHMSPGNGTPSAATGESERSLAKDTLPGHTVRGMVFSFNPQSGVLIPMAHLAPIPTTIIEAERHLLAWLPSIPRGLSLATTASESVCSVSLPSFAAPHLDDGIPRVTYALPSTLPASVSFSEDGDTMTSSGAAAVAKLSPTSKRSSRREKHRRIPDRKSEDGRFNTHSLDETLQLRAFQVEEKLEAEDARLSKVDDAEQSIEGVPIIANNLHNRIVQRLELESNQGVDLRTRKSGNKTGEVPTMGDTPAFEFKTESKSFTECDTNFGSCTSPLDLTTHCGSYGSLGSLKNSYTLSGSTIKTEKHDIQGDLRDSKDNIPNRIPNSEPIHHDTSRVRHDVPRTRGLAQSSRHGSVLNNIKGTFSVGPTSLMICEEKSPSADSTADKYELTQKTMCSFFKDSLSGSQETRMNLTDPELQDSRWKRSGSLLSGSIHDLSRTETTDVARVTLSTPVVWGHSYEAVALENTGHSRPGSQCSNDLQVEYPRLLEKCRLPPKKRKVHMDFDPEVQPNRGDLDSANGQDLSKISSIEEPPLKVSHPEQYHPLVAPLLTKDGSDGGVQMAQRLREQSVRDSTRSTVEIVVKVEIRDREDLNDGVNRKTATGRQKFGSGGMIVSGSSALSSFSSSSSSPSPRRTTTNCSIHSAIQPDEDGDLPLHVAVAQGLESVVDSLVSVMSQLDTHIDAFNKNRQTPLHVAVITNQREIVRKLLQAGACPNLSDRKGHNSVHLAVNNRCHECLRILLSDSMYSVDVDAMNYEGLMPLHLAVQLGDVHSVEALLSFGAQVNGVDGKNGRTALYYAAEKSDLASAELLLQTGASPSIASYSGCLPVNAARSSGAMVKVLERYSAGGDALMGLERSAAVAGGCGVAMVTTKTGNRDAKRRESKQVKSKE